jgi:L-arabinose transport system substrate-binding protein
MKTNTGLVVAGCAAVIMAAGILALSAARAAGDKPLTIAYIQKQGDQQYFVDEAQGARNEAKALGNVRVNVVNVQMDANAAISAMNVMVGQKVDGIAIVVPDQQIGPQVIDMATQAHIPLVSSDDPIKSGSGQMAAFVGFDGYQMGYKVGEAAGKLYKSAGWTAGATRVAAAYEQQLSVCQERENGEEAGFAAVAGTPPTIIKIGTDNSVVDAQNRTAAVVTANPQIKQTGAVTALANAGMRSGDIIGVGLGGYLTCKDWQAGQASGNKAALFISGQDVGSAAVRVLVDAIRNHTPLPAKTIATTTIVTPTTWKSVMGSCS